MINKVLKLFGKTLTVDEKHYPLYRDNLTQPSGIQLYQKQKTFSEFFFGFLKSILNFEHLRTKSDPHSLCISGKTGSQKHDSING